MARQVYVIAKSQGVADCIGKWIEGNVIPIMSFYPTLESAQNRIKEYPLSGRGQYQPFLVTINK